MLSLSQHQGAQQGHTGAYLNARIRAGIGLSLGNRFPFNHVGLDAARPRITWVLLIQQTRRRDFKRAVLWPASRMAWASRTSRMLLPPSLAGRKNGKIEVSERHRHSE